MGFCWDYARALLHCAGCSFPGERRTFCSVFVSAIGNGVISNAAESATEMVTVILVWPRCLECGSECASGRARGIGRALQNLEISRISMGVEEWIGSTVRCVVDQTREHWQLEVEEVIRLIPCQVHATRFRAQPREWAEMFYLAYLGTLVTNDLAWLSRGCLGCEEPKKQTHATSTTLKQNKMLPDGVEPATSSSLDQ